MIAHISNVPDSSGTRTEAKMPAKKTMKRSTSKTRSARAPKDLAVKRTTAIKGGLYKRSDPCTGEPLK